MRRGSRDARLERLEESARRRAAGRRKQRLAETEPYYWMTQEERDRLTAQVPEVLRMMIDEVGLLERAPALCPREGSGVQTPRVLTDQEACEEWRALADVIPLEKQQSASSFVAPRSQFPDEYDYERE